MPMTKVLVHERRVQVLTTTAIWIGYPLGDIFLQRTKGCLGDKDRIGCLLNPFGATFNMQIPLFRSCFVSSG